MSATPIEWTDFSINPFRARNKETGKCGHFCVKISPGCKNCYSSRTQPRFGTFPFLAENREKVELFLDESKLREVIARKKPTKFFWCDMTDMFLGDYPDEWIDRCFAAMALTPQHTHQVLTKRPERMLQYFSRQGCAEVYGPQDLWKVVLWFSGAHAEAHTTTSLRAPNGSSFPLPNVWLAVSAEDQPTWDERTTILEEVPAAIRFVSLEPQLGPVDVGPVLKRGNIHWLVQGGESGPGARAAVPEWFRSVRDECQATGTAFFLKQWGQWAPYGDASKHKYRDVPVGDGTHHRMFSVGKKAAGAMLDGREWREFPQITNR